MQDANSTEVDPTTTNPLVIDMPEHHSGKMGGTMRLGRRTTVFKGTSVMRKLYGNVETIDERHRHRYEVNPKYVEALEEKGLKFVGHDSEKTRMEIIELEGHPFYVGVQFHPEYLSRPLKPSPPFMGLILASVGKLQSYLNHGCRLSPRQLSDESSDDEEMLMQRLKISNQSRSLAVPLPELNGFANGYGNGTSHIAESYPQSSNGSSTDETEK